MATFTADWFTAHSAEWLVHVAPRLKGISGARWLEIGSYEGLSALWTLEHVLPPGGTVVCVDFFDDRLAGIDFVDESGVPRRWAEPDYEARFDANTASNPGIVKRKGRSSKVLADLEQRGIRFHGAYIDGEHREKAVFDDLWLTWPLLLPGAVLVCDDYGYDRQPGVKAAADRFLSGNHMRVLHAGYQIIILKHD
jgi:hypothetical protein